MSNDNAIYRGEAWLRNWSETAKGGRRITLQVEEDGPQIFKGYEGERFMIVCVPIGNDDKPMVKAEPTGRALGGHARAAALSPERRTEIASNAAKRRWSDLRPSARAAIALDDDEFRTYVCGGVDTVPDGDEADECLKARLGITSKRELDQDQTKAAAFDRLYGNFKAFQQARQLGAA